VLLRLSRRGPVPDDYSVRVSLERFLDDEHVKHVASLDGLPAEFHKWRSDQYVEQLSRYRSLGILKHDRSAFRRQVMQAFEDWRIIGGTALRVESGHFVVHYVLQLANFPFVISGEDGMHWADLNTTLDVKFPAELTTAHEVLEFLDSLAELGRPAMAAWINSAIDRNTVVNTSFYHEHNEDDLS
jgi:hypothetical protein